MRKSYLLTNTDSAIAARTLNDVAEYRVVSETVGGKARPQTHANYIAQAKEYRLKATRDGKGWAAIEVMAERKAMKAIRQTENAKCSSPANRQIGVRTMDKFTTSYSPTVDGIPAYVTSALAKPWDDIPVWSGKGAPPAIGSMVTDKRGREWRVVSYEVRIGANYDWLHAVVVQPATGQTADLAGAEIDYGPIATSQPAPAVTADDVISAIREACDHGLPVLDAESVFQAVRDVFRSR